VCAVVWHGCNSNSRVLPVYSPKSCRTLQYLDIEDVTTSKQSVDTRSTAQSPVNQKHAKDIQPSLTTLDLAKFSSKAVQSTS
jgi:hypothetical protein